MHLVRKKNTSTQMLGTVHHELYGNYLHYFHSNWLHVRRLIGPRIVRFPHTYVRNCRQKSTERIWMQHSDSSNIRKSEIIQAHSVPYSLSLFHDWVHTRGLTDANHTDRNIVLGYKLAHVTYTQTMGPSFGQHDWHDWTNRIHWSKNSYDIYLYL